MSQGCGILTKGNHPKDDLIACGTRLWFVQDNKTITESVLLCKQCKLTK